MLVLYTIFFSFLLFKFLKFKKTCTLTIFLIIGYLVSSLCAVFLYYTNNFPDYKNVNISLHSVIYLIFNLFLLIWGFSFIEQKISRYTIPLIKFNKLVPFIIVLICGSIFSIHDSLNLISSFQTYDVSEIRYAYTQNELYESRTGQLIGYLKSTADLLYPVSIILAFYILHHYPRKWYMAIVLIILSTSVIFSNMTIAGRDAIAKWILMFMAIFLLNKNIIPSKINRIIIISLGCIAFFSFQVTVLITKARFGEGTDTILLNFIEYYGQGFIHFSKFFDLFFDGSYFGKISFPFLFPVDERISIAQLNANTFKDVSYQLNVFPTIIGSFYMDFGYFGTFFVCLTLLFISIFISKIYTNNIFYYILYIFVFQIILSGIFYFMYYAPQFQKIIVLLILFNIYFKFFRNTSKSFSYMKKYE